MATINDLKEIESKPVTIEQWLNRFNDSDRKIVIDSIIKGKTSDLYPILKNLDDNPFPFKRDTINHARNLLRMRSI